MRKLIRKRVDCPVVLQMEAVECGAAALSMVMSYYGVIVPLEQLRDECGVSRDGSKASSILKVARKYHFTAQGYREESLDRLDQHSKPSILFWNFNHFVVYTGRHGRNYCINDPAVGAREVSESEMDGSFSGILLELTPGENFHPQGKNRSMGAGLWRRMAGCRGVFFLLLLTGLLLVPGNLLSPNLSKIFVDNFLLDRFFNWGTPLITMALLTLVVTWLLTWIQCNALLRLNIKMSVVCSAEFMLRLLYLPVAFFSSRQSGELSTRLEQNDKIAAFVSEQLAVNLLSMFTIVFYALIMFCYDSFLGMLALLMGISIIVLLKLELKSRQLLGQSIQLDRGQLYGSSISGIMLIETLKASGGENDFFSQWSGFQSRYLLGRQKLDVSTVQLSAFPGAVQKITVALVTGIGALRILSGSMSGGAYLVFQLILGYFFAPLEQLVNMGTQLQEVDAGLKRLDDVLDYPGGTAARTELERIEELSCPAKMSGKLELKEVTFGYNPASEPVLRNFSLELNPGERVALVGGSGSGKSTVARLVSGLYKPWSGEILFDGRTREAYPLSVFTNSFALVDQDIFFFNGTIYDNLTMFNPGIPLATVERAARDAAIHDLISRRSFGYFSDIDEGGANFSGGERQRLELARALTVNPSLLVLDEATSALDPATEREIDMNLRRRGCSCLIIAHRLSTIRDADKIVVLAGGEIVESGTHDELIRLNGVYAGLVAEL